MTPPPDDTRPCQTCGACCAHFRVSFYWSEALARGLPESLVEQVNPWMSCMAGTQGSAPRCAALQGTVGTGVSCTVYPQRPETCREVQVGDNKCARARARYDLPPLGGASTG